MLVDELGKVLGDKFKPTQFDLNFLEAEIKAHKELLEKVTADSIELKNRLRIYENMHSHYTGSQEL